MSDNALRAALQKLLAQGEQASDNQLLKAHAAKNAPPPVAPEMCEDCKVPYEGGKCPKCGKEAQAGEDEGELASLLEQGASEE